MSGLPGVSERRLKLKAGDSGSRAPSPPGWMEARLRRLKRRRQPSLVCQASWGSREHSEEGYSVDGARWCPPLDRLSPPPPDASKLQDS